LTRIISRRFVDCFGFFIGVRCQALSFYFGNFQFYLTGIQAHILIELPHLKVSDSKPKYFFRFQKYFSQHHSKLWPRSPPDFWHNYLRFFSSK